MRSRPRGLVGRLRSWFVQEEEEFLPAVPETDPRAVGPPTLAAMAPPMPSAEQMIVEYINWLAESGALDEGSGHVLDDTIDAWVRQWAEQANAAHQLRMLVHERRRKQLEVESNSYNMELDELRRQLAAVNNQLLGLEEDLSRTSPDRERPRPRTDRSRWSWLFTRSTGGTWTAPRDADGNLLPIPVEGQSLTRPDARRDATPSGDPRPTGMRPGEASPADEYPRIPGVRRSPEPAASPDAGAEDETQPKLAAPAGNSHLDGDDG